VYMVVIREKVERGTAKKCLSLAYSRQEVARWSINRGSVQVKKGDTQKRTLSHCYLNDGVKYVGGVSELGGNHG